MRRTLSLVLVIFMSITMLIGCNNGTTSKEQMKSEATTAEAYEPKSLGSAAFTVDDAKTTSVNYPADGTEATLSVTDTKGLTWRLDIPKDALLQSQTIKMTAMSSVSADTLGPMAGGVVLEPDGLTFLTPAKLTVTGEGVKVKSLLLTGKQDGSDLTFTSCENKEGGVSADIFHFSTAVMSDWDEDSQLKNMADHANQQLSDAMKKANDILKRSIDEPPIPPDISLKCKKGSHDLDINKYYNQFMQELKEPEMSIVTELLAAERSNQLLGNSKNDDALNTAARLLDRLRTKVKKLIDKYQSQPDKFYATSAAFIEVEKMYQLAGGKDETNWEPLRKWCEKVAQHYLSELTDKHDYAAIHAVVRAARSMELLGGDGDAYLTKLDNALKFDLKIDLNMRTVADYYLKYEITSTISMQLTLGGDLVVGEGSGTCEYALAECPIGEFKAPSSYPCEAMITQFDPCTKEVVKLSLDKIGAEAETWYYTLSGQTVTDDNTSQWLADMLFADENSTSHDFTMDLKNLNADAVDQTLDKKTNYDGLDLEGSMHVTLKHKPNN